MNPRDKKFKALIETATRRCEHATVAELEAWAAQDTVLAMFAQKELVFREMGDALYATAKPMRWIAI